MHPSLECHTAGRLAMLLQQQHRELTAVAERLLECRGSARLDLFLKFRRWSALHRALEELVVHPLAGDGGGTPPCPDVAPVVAALESGSAGTDWELLTRAVWRHRRCCDRRTASLHAAPLTAGHSQTMEAIDQLWAREAEVLGSTRAEMLWILHSELSRLTATGKVDGHPELTHTPCVRSIVGGTALVAGPVDADEVR